jgi:hypothetical protein
METVRFSESSVNFHHSTWHGIPEDRQSVVLIHLSCKFRIKRHASLIFLLLIYLKSWPQRCGSYLMGSKYIGVENKYGKVSTWSVYIFWDKFSRHFERTCRVQPWRRRWHFLPRTLMDDMALRRLQWPNGLRQCCPTFLCTRAQFTDAYGGAGATTLLLLLLPLNTYYYY